MTAETDQRPPRPNAAKSAAAAGLGVGAICGTLAAASGYGAAALVFGGLMIAIAIGLAVGLVRD
ncbi:hypothetical protein [Rhodopseudomonas sp. BR0G17]|uniref:hypothetical protein n=1 Tax=Rhodopseudomonas sp. BR0G17 TaxID=2269368 RepID=UPI0013E0A91D|nr:hypothetical protein [Rhodopseudomonas sp. BR0G17]